MLAGLAATQQCFNTSSLYGGLLPADLDGPTPPPTGSPSYVLNFGSSALNMWKFHVDWANPAASTFTGPTSIPTAAFAAACSSGGDCIPQAGTSNRLDSLADRLMYRLAYRNFGDHESLVVNHSVTAGLGRDSLVRAAQSRRHADRLPAGHLRARRDLPLDGHDRDGHSGDIGLAYSASSSTMKPAIRYRAGL